MDSVQMNQFSQNLFTEMFAMNEVYNSNNSSLQTQSDLEERSNNVWKSLSQEDRKKWTDIGKSIYDSSQICKEFIMDLESFLTGEDSKFKFKEDKSVQDTLSLFLSITSSIKESQNPFFNLSLSTSLKKSSLDAYRGFYSLYSQFKDKENSSVEMGPNLLYISCLKLFSNKFMEILHILEVLCNCDMSTSTCHSYSFNNECKKISLGAINMCNKAFTIFQSLLESDDWTTPCYENKECFDKLSNIMASFKTLSDTVRTLSSENNALSKLQTFQDSSMNDQASHIISNPFSSTTSSIPGIVKYPELLQSSSSEQYNYHDHYSVLSYTYTPILNYSLEQTSCLQLHKSIEEDNQMKSQDVETPLSIHSRISPHTDISVEDGNTIHSIDPILTKNISEYSQNNQNKRKTNESVTSSKSKRTRVDEFDIHSIESSSIKVDNDDLSISKQSVSKSPLYISEDESDEDKNKSKSPDVISYMKKNANAKSHKTPKKDHHKDIGSNDSKSDTVSTRHSSSYKHSKDSDSDSESSIRTEDIAYQKELPKFIGEQYRQYKNIQSQLVWDPSRLSPQQEEQMNVFMPLFQSSQLMDAYYQRIAQFNYIPNDAFRDIYRHPPVLNTDRLSPEQITKFVTDLDDIHSIYYTYFQNLRLPDFIDILYHMPIMQHEDSCCVCGRSGGTLSECTTCPRAFHNSCYKFPDNQHICPNCKNKTENLPTHFFNKR